MVTKMSVPVIFKPPCSYDYKYTLDIVLNLLVSAYNMHFYDTVS